jgi:hypothetical protein
MGCHIPTYITLFFYKDKYGGLVTFLSNRIKHRSYIIVCGIGIWLSVAGTEDSNLACIDYPLTIRNLAVSFQYVNQE